MNLLRETVSPHPAGYRRMVTTHVCIPAAYKSGITLFARRDGPAYELLKSASELPFLVEKKDD